MSIPIRSIDAQWVTSMIHFSIVQDSIFHMNCDIISHMVLWQACG